MSKFCLIASYPTSVIKFRGDLLRAIAMKGIEIHIILPSIDEKVDPGLREKLNALGYRLHEISMQRTGLNPLQDLKTIYSIYDCLKSIKPEYVLAYTIKPVVYGMIAARLSKVPQRYALITGLGYAFQGITDKNSSISKFQKIIFGMYRFALKRVNKVIFQNPDDLHLFKSLDILNAKAKTGIVNGSGVDTSLYNQTSLPRDSKGVVIPHFLLIARLLGDKGVREYAEAASIIKSRYPNVKFSLVGWIDTNPDAIQQSELDEWVNDRRLNYLGRLTDVRPAIEQASVFVLPSYREGTPRTVLEAMSMGRAVITTDAPGCRETVIDRDNGYLVSVKSVIELTEAMEKFVQEPALIEQMGYRSRQIAEHKFDVNEVNQNMLKEMGIN